MLPCERARRLNVAQTNENQFDSGRVWSELSRMFLIFVRNHPKMVPPGPGTIIIFEPLGSLFEVWGVHFRSMWPHVELTSHAGPPTMCMDENIQATTMHCGPCIRFYVLALEHDKKKDFG